MGKKLGGYIYIVNLFKCTSLYFNTRGSVINRAQKSYVADKLRDTQRKVPKSWYCMIYICLYHKLKMFTTSICEIILARDFLFISYLDTLS